MTACHSGEKNTVGKYNTAIYIYIYIYIYECHFALMHALTCVQCVALRYTSLTARWKTFFLCIQMFKKYVAFA